MGLANKFKGFGVLWQFDNRWQLILSRLFSTNLSIYRFKGMEILVDRAAGEASITGEVMTSPMYLKYLPEMGLTGPVNIFDIGSNNGSFSLSLKSNNIQINKLVCVEMNPRTFTRLQHNISHNIGRGYVLVNGAICGEHRELEVSMGEGGAGESILYDTEGGNKEIVQGYTFDEIFDREFGDGEVDLCKMDIEGAEFEVFASDAYSRFRKCRNVLIEIHQKVKNDRGFVIDKLKDMGFVEVDGEGKNDADDHVHFFKRK